jgi:hypothetical protein
MKSVIMWQTISRLFFFILITSCDPGLARDAPQTPQPNSSERKAIVDTLRAPVEKELKQKVVFRIRRLKMQNGGRFCRVCRSSPMASQSTTETLGTSPPLSLTHSTTAFLLCCGRRKADGGS